MLIGTKERSPIGTKPKDHRIRLNDDEIQTIFEALKAYQGQRAAASLRWRFNALIKKCPVRR